MRKQTDGGEVKIHKSYEGNVGFEQMYKQLEMLNAAEYVATAKALGIYCNNGGFLSPNGEVFILVGTSDVDSSSCMKNPSGAVGYTVTRAVGRCNISLLSLSSHEFSVSELAINPIAKIVFFVILIFLAF